MPLFFSTKHHNHPMNINSNQFVVDSNFFTIKMPSSKFPHKNRFLTNPSLKSSHLAISNLLRRILFPPLTIYEALKFSPTIYTQNISNNNRKYKKNCVCVSEFLYQRVCVDSSNDEKRINNKRKKVRKTIKWKE